MATYDADLQAAVDSTGVALLAGQTDDLVQYLRDQLAEREIETSDDAWLQRQVDGLQQRPGVDGRRRAERLHQPQARHLSGSARPFGHR